MVQAKTQKTGDRRNRLLRPANPSAAQFMTPRRSEESAPRRRRRLPEAHLFLAECSAPRQVQRDLERSESRAVDSRGRIGKSASMELRCTTRRCNPLQSEANVPDRVYARSCCSIRNVAKSFGRNTVLKDISLEIAEGEFLTILGESGSGKTTLLRIIAGFEHATSGEVWMHGERLDNLPPYRRRVNTVFQHYALFPHLTVEQNVGLRIARRERPEARSRHARRRSAGHSQDDGLRAHQSHRRSAEASSSALHWPARW